MKIRKDIFGFELEIGDSVAYNPPRYKGLVTGVIDSFTPKKIRVNRNTKNSEPLIDIVSEVALELTGIYSKEIIDSPDVKRMVQEHLNLVIPEAYI